MSPLVHILEHSAIPIIIGVCLLRLYQKHPERFPRRWTPRYVTILAAILIIGSVLLAIWDTYRNCPGPEREGKLGRVNISPNTTAVDARKG
jgi:hypothetical protein